MQGAVRTPVDVFDKALYAAGVREVFFLSGAAVNQLDFYAIIQERKLADALGRTSKWVEESEGFGVRQGNALQCHGGLVSPVIRSELAFALTEFHLVDLAVTADRELEPGRTAH